jgi:Ca-activated chloride channel family protein
MIDLEWPWALLFLPLPFLAQFLLPPAQPWLGLALKLPFYHELTKSQFQPQQNFWHRWLAGLAWLLLIIATSRPQWLGKPVDLPISGRDLLLAIDISGSMQQKDYQLGQQMVSRLDVVKTVAGNFIEIRDGDRLGLILFGTRAYLQTPLTFDRATVKTMLKDAVIGLAGRDTAIGDAIGLAVKRLRELTNTKRILVLLTDGTNTAGALSPLEAAKLATQTGIRIYTIGIGGGSTGVNTPFGMLLQNASDLDPTTLKEIAKITGGKFFQATDTTELESIYAELDRLEPAIRDTRRFRPLTALFMWPASAALILALVLMVTGMLKWRSC